MGKWVNPLQRLAVQEPINSGVPGDLSTPSGSRGWILPLDPTTLFLFPQPSYSRPFAKVRRLWQVDPLHLGESRQRSPIVCSCLATEYSTYIPRSGSGVPFHRLSPINRGNTGYVRKPHARPSASEWFSILHLGLPSSPLVGSASCCLQSHVLMARQTRLTRSPSGSS